MIIDSHQHFWRLDSPFQYDWLKTPEHEPICRDRMPEHLHPEMLRTGVERTVVVQTQHDLVENRWALELADQNSWIAGVVGWIDLADERCEEQLEEFSSDPRFVGVRHITQDERDDHFIVSDAVVRGLKVLEKHAVPFDLLFYRRHLRHVPELAERLPTLPMVIDHLSKPDIRSARLDPWRSDLRAASQFPNVYCKFSGMVTEADWRNWKSRDLEPFVDAALESFGPERCMFGSDWPVCELAATYSDVFHALQELLSKLSESERASIFGRTAEQFYQLPAAH